MLLINYKTYSQASGLNALKLTQELIKIAAEFPAVPVGFAPPLIELAAVARSGAPVWAQHADSAPEGQYTGYLSPANIRSAEAVGIFLNHSEHPLEEQKIAETVPLAREAGLKILIFAKDPAAVASFKRLEPDLIAYEPPELIGGDLSVTAAKPEIIREAVAAAESIPLLIGAGVHEKTDIATAVSLGAIGAVVASAVVTSPDPAKIFRELLAGFPAKS